jgi:transcriptional regulator with XRE-family HTH domain
MAGDTPSPPGGERGETTVGERIWRERDRAGMTRRVLGDRVGRSAGWVKAVEYNRLLPPRLPMLSQIAAALGIRDLATLAGDGYAVPVSVFAGTRHAALSAVQAALTDYRVSSPTGGPPRLAHLALRLSNAWRVRHSSSDHRTRLGALLPDLIRDAQLGVRTLRDEQRRSGRRILAGVYQLTDFYVAYQPAPELVWMVADRALTEGQEADDPYVEAGGAWAMVQALRDSGRWDEAIALADSAIGQLAPHLDGAPSDWRGMVGALESEVAYVHARRGRHGEAWGRWERAHSVAHRLGPDYRHVQTSFSQAVVSAHATTLGVELQRPGEALRAADSVDPNAIPSLARRSRHLIEVARAHHQAGEPAAAWAMLSSSERTATETIKYNGYARQMLTQLRDHPPTGLRADVNALCRKVGVTG